MSRTRIWSRLFVVTFADDLTRSTHTYYVTNCVMLERAIELVTPLFLEQRGADPDPDGTPWSVHATESLVLDAAVSNDG